MDYQEENIGFYVDRVNSSEPNGIVIVDVIWKWKNAKIMMDPIPMVGFYVVVVNWGKVYPPGAGDSKEECETPVMLLVPSGLPEWIMDTLQTPWELHKKIKSIQPELVRDMMLDYPKPALQWCLHVTQIASGATNTLHIQPMEV